jgi:Flp pilus assembly secretin CpaC
MQLNSRPFTIFLTCIATLVVVTSTRGQTTSDASPIYPQPYRQSDDASVTPVPPIPQPVYRNPYTSTLAHPEKDEARKKQAAKAEHLRRAAEHLTAAGKTQLAERLIKEAMLEEKLGQICKLQAEVEELRGTVSTEPTVILNVKIMELQTTKMRELGLDFQTADGRDIAQFNGETLIEVGEYNGLIEALREHNLVKVLAEPTIATVSGRPASFQSGGEFPIVVPESPGNQSIEYRQFGTRVDCLAKVLDDGRIRVELHPEVTEIDASRSVVIQDNSVPGLRTRAVDTAVVMDAGQTLVLSGLNQRRPKDADDSDSFEETALLVTVTADLGEPVKQAKKKGASIRR